MDEEQWVELCKVTSEVEAQVIQSLLVAADIPVMLRSSLARSVYPSLSQVKILVLRKDLETAQDMLSQSPEEPSL
ncbi:MAG: DUF2007 domain-containing protein [Bacillota bacterium]|nr:DUF2007 domain-containing protein [Bacillota bacterium]